MPLMPLCTYVPTPVRFGRQTSPFLKWGIPDEMRPQVLAAPQAPNYPFSGIRGYNGRQQQQWRQRQQEGEARMATR